MVGRFIGLTGSRHSTGEAAGRRPNVRKRMASEDQVSDEKKRLAAALAGRIAAEESLAAESLKLAREVAARLANGKKAKDSLAAESRKLAETVVALAESNKRLAEFIYAASHDLRTPLRAIISFLQLLEERNPDLDDESKEFLAYAVRGAKRMHEMTKGIVELSSVGQDGLQSLVDTGDVLAEAIRALRPEAIESDSAIEVPESMPRILGNPYDLTRLFQNLIGNAIKFHHPDRRPVIRVECLLQEKDWRFAVRDNGLGIASSHFDRIFQIFQRLHGDKDGDGGVGVGLALCRSIVERHHGEIWVESVLGEGTSFYFILPSREE